jgi:hypothetical protein
VRLTRRHGGSRRSRLICRLHKSLLCVECATQLSFPVKSVSASLHFLFPLSITTFFIIVSPLTR